MSAFYKPGVQSNLTTFIYECQFIYHTSLHARQRDLYALQFGRSLSTTYVDKLRV